MEDDPDLRALARQSALAIDAADVALDYLMSLVGLSEGRFGTDDGQRASSIASRIARNFQARGLAWSSLGPYAGDQARRARAAMKDFVEEVTALAREAPPHDPRLVDAVLEIDLDELARFPDRLDLSGGAQEAGDRLRALASDTQATAAILHTAQTRVLLAIARNRA